MMMMMMTMMRRMTTRWRTTTRTTTTMFSFLAITPVWDLIETWGFREDLPLVFPHDPMLYLTTIMEKPHLLWRGLFEGSRITDLYLLIVYLLLSYNLLYSQNLLYLILSYLTIIHRWNLSVCLSFGLVNFSWRCG